MLLSRMSRTVYIIVILLFGFGTATYGQWSQLQNIVPVNKTHHGNSMFFFNEMRGIVGYTGHPAYGIWLTNDGGATWKQAKYPTGFSGSITQIIMSDSLNGWATIEHDPQAPCLWKTTDGGNTWNTVGPLVHYSSVYQSPTALITTTRSLTLFGQTSLDGGSTFQPNPLQKYNDVNFIDDKIGVATAYTNSPWQRTTDGGITWNVITPQITTEAWSIYADKSTKIFYTAGEKDPTIRGSVGNSEVLRSVDLGLTWQSIHTFPFFTNGHITGSKGKLYVQVENIIYNAPYTGLYRSDDNGVTWKSIGGPTHENDRRFYVTGCNGGIVYAFDDRQFIYKTRSGGDGSIFEPTPEPVVAGLPITLSSRICDSITTNISIANQYCDSLYLIGIDFPDDTLGLITSGAIQYLSTGFPRTIGSDKQTTITLRWSPSHITHKAVTLPMRIRIRYASPVYPTIRDTSFEITLEAIADPPAVSIVPQSINFGNIPFCSSIDTTVTIMNMGCDLLIIDSIFSTQPQFDRIQTQSGQQLSYPITIVPGQSLALRISFTSNVPSVYSAVIRYLVSHQGLHDSLTSTYTVTVTNDNVFRIVMSPPVDTLFHEVLTRCDIPKNFPIQLSNPACLKLSVLGVDIIGAPPQNVSASIIGGTPRQLLTGESADVTVTVTPSLLGNYNGIIRIRYQFEGETARDTVLQYLLTVNYGSRILSVEPQNIDAGSLRLCITKDTSVLLRNLGCDTLEIRSIDMTSSPPFFTFDSPTTTILPPNAATTVRIHLTPDYSGSVTADLRISSTSDSTDPQVVDIRAYIIPTDTVTLRLVPLRNTFHVGDTVTIRLMSESDVYQTSALRDITFGVNFNGDLLTLVKADPLIPGAALLAGVSSRTLPAKRETQMYFLQGNPFITFSAGQPLAEFRFFVTLTDTTTAFFYLSDIALNGSDTNYARCTLGLITAQTSGVLELLCGDSTLIEFMRTGKVVGLRTVPSYPNPLTSAANYRLTIEFESAADEPVVLTVFDISGRSLHQRSISSHKGKNSILFDASAFASGQYYFVLRSSSETTRAGSFILQR